MNQRERISGLVAALVVGTGILFSFPAPAAGQARTWVGESLAQMVEAAHWRLGAFRVNAALELTNAGYDTDIYYGYFDEPVKDYTFSASLPVQVLLPLGKKFVLELYDSPQYLFYLETNKERAWNNVFRGQAHFAFERVYVSAGGGLSDVRMRLSPELNVNIRQKEDSLNGTFLWQASREFSFAILSQASRFDYGEAEFGGIRLAETLNRDELSIDLIGYLQPSSRVRLFADAQYGTFSFREPTSRFKDTRSYGVFGGLAFVPREGEERPIAPPQGSVSLGYMRFDILDPLFKDGSGFVGAADISTGLFRRTVARASFARNYAFSAYSAATFYLTTTFGGGLARQLSRRSSLSYDISFNRSVYPEEEGGAPSPARNFRYTSHVFSLGVQLGRRLVMTLQASLARRTLDEGEAVRNRNLFGMSLTYGFPAGRITAPTRGLGR